MGYRTSVWCMIEFVWKWVVPPKCDCFNKLHANMRQIFTRLLSRNFPRTMPLERDVSYSGHILGLHVQCQGCSLRSCSTLFFLQMVQIYHWSLPDQASKKGMPPEFGVLLICVEVDLEPLLNDEAKNMSNLSGAEYLMPLIILYAGLSGGS